MIDHAPGWGWERNAAPLHSLAAWGSRGYFDVREKRVPRFRRGVYMGEEVLRDVQLNQMPDRTEWVGEFDSGVGVAFRAFVRKHCDLMKKKRGIYPLSGMYYAEGVWRGRLMYFYGVEQGGYVYMNAHMVGR